MSPAGGRWALLRDGRIRAAIALLLGGLGLLVLVPRTAMGARETVELAGIALAAAALPLLLALVLLPRLRTRSLGTQAAVVAGLPAVGLALGAALASERMFLSGHDAAVLQIVLVAASASAWASAFLLGDRVGRASSGIAAATRSLVEGAEPTTAGLTGASRELDDLARTLEATSRDLAEARARERALERSRRELIAWVSHDLRTPLAGIRAVAEALEDGIATDPATVARYHTTIRVEADQLAALIDDLFELSRAEAGAVPLRLERVPLADLVSDAIATITPVASEKGVTVEGSVPPHAGDALVSPPELLRAVRNLLENAVRHTPTGGTVTVEARIEDDHAVLSVRDVGGGIPEQHLERIFDAGYRLDPARTPRAGGGTGLGLAIARGLVEAHHGQLEVANEGAGARFTMRVPAGASGEIGEHPTSAGEG